MTEDTLARLIAQAHEAAIGLSPWTELGATLRVALDCTRTTLLHGPSDGASFVDLMDQRPVDPRFARYRRLDPSLPLSVAIAARRLDLKEVAQGFEVVPEHVFRRSEYYTDYARRAGLYHRLVFSGIRGGRHMAPFAVHRPEDASPFDETERGFLLRLKPHIKRALALRERARLGGGAIGQGFAALEVHGEPIVVVDGDLRLIRVNAAAETLLGSSDSPLRIVSGGPTDGIGMIAVSILKASRRSDSELLARLVRAVAIGGRAVGPRRFARTEDGGPGIALDVLPVPARLMDGDRRPGSTPGLAMIVLLDLRRPRPPAIGVLRDLFDLSLAEAAVVRALADGATADKVAAMRGVALETVRSQIRAVLRKVGADGLRDLERILTLVPRSSDR